MSSTIIGDVMAVKLKNGKFLPFVLSAASNVRTYNNSYAWTWHNIFVGKHSNFMFDRVEQVQEAIKLWTDSGSVKYRNGGFITAYGMNKRLEKAFAMPVHFESGLFLLQYIKISEDRTKAEIVMFKPKTEEDFLTYMEENKQHSINIMISTNKEFLNISTSSVPREVLN